VGDNVLPSTPHVLAVDEGLSVIDGAVSRLVVLSDDSSRLETWSPVGGRWLPVGTTVWSFVEASKSSPETLAAFNIPPAGDVGSVQRTRRPFGAPEAAVNYAEE